MKQILVMIAAVALVGCGKQQPENTTDGGGAANKPENSKGGGGASSKSLTKEAVVGTFGSEKRIVFKPDGSVETWRGEKKTSTLTWVITNGEIFIKFPPGTPGSKGQLGQYYIITAGNDLEWVAVEEERGRKDVDDLRMAGNRKFSKEMRIFKRIK